MDERESQSPKLQRQETSHTLWVALMLLALFVAALLLCGCAAKAGQVVDSPGAQNKTGLNNEFTAEGNEADIGDTAERDVRKDRPITQSGDAGGGNVINTIIQDGWVTIVALSLLAVTLLGLLYFLRKSGLLSRIVNVMGTEVARGWRNGRSDGAIRNVSGAIIGATSRKMEELKLPKKVVRKALGDAYVDASALQDKPE